MDVIQKIIYIHLKYRRHGNRIDGVIVSVLTSRAVDRGFGGIIRPLVSASALTWFIRYISYPNLQFLNYVHVIIIKTKVILPSLMSPLFMSFDFLALKHFKIIWGSNILVLSVPEEGYS
jgi:hypothetical protein